MIHPTAIIDPTAKLHESVEVGPFSQIGSNVIIDRDTVIASNVIIKRNTTIGKGNHIFQFTSIGEDCQDLKYAGEDTFLEIGDNNNFREGVTIHRGTVQDQGMTKIGSGNLFMVNAHIAHDCIIGDNIVVATGAAIAGHVKIGDYAIIGGVVGIHQFCQIGAYTMIGGGSVVFKDVPAFITTAGNPATACVMNFEGMKRRGFTKENIQNLRRAYKIVYRNGLTLEKAKKALITLANEDKQVNTFLQSIAASNRGIIR